MIKNDTILRADNIDILKSICAFLIVCIHVPFPGEIGSYITALSRIAVPVFFMITGFFYSDVVKKSRITRQIKKIFILMIEANLVYFVWKWFFTAVTMDTDFLSTIFTAKNLLKFVLFNDSPLNGHLWYLGAILYVLIINSFVEHLNLSKVLYWLTSVLLIMDLLLGKYSLVLLNREFPYILVRNFLFVSIPYFCIGRMIREGFGQRANRRTLALLILLFSLTTCIERFILVGVAMNPTRDHYISSTLLAIAVFLFVLRCGAESTAEVSGGTGNVEEPVNLDKNIVGGGYWLADLLATIGRKYSTWLYIIHPIFITCIGAVMNKIGLYGVYKYVAPVVVYIVTLVFLMAVDRIKQILLKREK